MAKKNNKRKRKRKPLKADPKRQATDSLRGYRYQILHSVNAWLDLAEGEILYLEGVEDFDILSDDTATVVQVKDTQRNITLKSQEVLKAINHYWESRTNHPNLIMRFRFITRSKIGKEQGNPFGNDQQGLRSWNRCSGDEEIITKISGFLQTQETISDEVKDFLKQSVPQQIYEQLIEPITWETGSSDSNSVKKYMSDKLVNHGNKLGLLPSDISKVLNALLNEAFAVATHRENRELTKARFFEIFEAETTQRVSTQHLRHLQRQATLAAELDTVSAALVGDSSDITIQSQSPIQDAIPPLYPDVIERTNLLTSIQTKLQSEGITIIQGGTGKGKTTLANLIANDIKGAWSWHNFTNKDSSQILQTLQQLFITISNESSQVNVVLDDLSLQPQQLRMYKEELSTLVYKVMERGAKLLITSQYKPRSNLLRSLGLSSSVVINVPNFTISEIKQFAQQLGCPEEDAKTWAELFQFPTRRHPGLVHALLTHLREKDWEQQDVIKSILQTPQEVIEEHEAARQLLMDLPEDRREFLYRLSMLTEFRKDYALNIGEIPKPIRYTGDVFSQLVGPWIDQVSENYYIISPLLKDAAKEVWSESQINKLHAQIANAILNTKSLTSIEARAVFLHSMIGRNREGLVAVIWSLINASQDDWEIVSKEFSFLIPMKIDLPEKLYLGDAFVKYLMRFLQYRIAVKSKPEFAPEVLDVWDKETKLQQQSQEYQLLRRMLATEALRYNQVLLPAEKMVNYLKEVVDITSNDKEIQEIDDDSIAQLEENKSDNFNYLSNLFRLIWMRQPFHNSFLSTLIDTLDEFQPKIRALLLANFEDHSIEPQLLIDGVWLSEAQLDSPDWTRCLQVFDKVIERTIAWGYPHIAAASARGKAIIHDEKLNNSDTAHKVLQDIASKVGALPVIEEAQAVVYLHQEHYRKALNIYERILPEWTPPSEQLDIGPLEEYRQAAICAASLGDWEKAATFLEDGAKRTQKIESTERYIGLYADAGFAHFKAGNMVESIKLLNLALQKFETLPQDNTDVNYFTLKKRLACSIGWIAYHESENYTSESEEPPVGFCSNPETNEEVLNLPDSRIEYMWLALARIECKFGHGTTVLDHVLQIVDPEANPVLSSSVSLLEVQYDFKNKTFDNLPRRIHQLANASDLIQEHNQNTKKNEEKGIGSLSIARTSNLASVENIITILVSALIAQLPTNRNVHETLIIWRTNSSGLPIENNMTIALNLIESILFGDQNHALTVMKTQETKPEKRLVAALKIVYNIESNPNNLFYAHVLIATFLIREIWEGFAGTDLANLLSAQWLEKIKFRATLKTPMLTVPRIEQTCNSSETGKKKIGQILLAASQAVSIKVAPEVLQQFRSWAESESEEKQELTTAKNPIAQRLIEVMEKPPHLTHEDVDALHQSIEEGKIPIKFDSPFEPDEHEKE